MARSKGTYDYSLGISLGAYDYSNKENLINDLVRWGMNAASSMLEFENLPETMPERDIKRLLQINGFMVVPRPEYLDGKLYAFRAGLGGEPDPYYMPTMAVISNPALQFNKELKIGEGVFLIKHDPYLAGLTPIIRQWATMTAEADLSIYMATTLSRDPFKLAAKGERAYAEAKEYIDNLVAGKMDVIKEPSFFDEAVRSLSASQGNLSSRMLTDLIEVKQYLLANMFWNKLGVNSNYNMKRESLNSAESQLNDDALLPYPNIIVKTIQGDLDKLNEAVGSDIKVRLGSVWGDRRELQDAQVEIMTEGGDPDGSSGETETSEPEQVPEEQPV